MEIEYIYPNQDDDDNKNFKKQVKQMQKDSTLGCLILALCMLGVLFIFFTILPIILVVLGYSILFLSIYIIYKAYLEVFVLNFIEKLKRK